MKVLALVFTAATAVTAGKYSLDWEKPGGIFRSISMPGAGCDQKVIRDSQPVGRMEELGGYQSYVSDAPNKNTKQTIIYLSDIFGLPLVNNKLLADSLAKSGYLVVFPDLFKGDYIPADALTNIDPATNKTRFDLNAWRVKHPIAEVDSIIAATITAVKAKYKAERIGAVGYCFGGKYVARFLKKDGGVDVGFVAHPSNITVDEAKELEFPISVAYADNDNANPPEARDQFEEIMFRNGNTWQQTLYSWTQHGFAVRANMSDARSKFAQESAYRQAVTWFNAWLPLP